MGRGGGLTTKGHEGTSRVIEMFCISVVVVVTQLFTLAQTYQTVKLNVRILYYVNYISVD